MRASLPMHGVILSTAGKAAQFTSSLRITSGAELHLVDDVTYLQDCLEAVSANIRLTYGVIKVFGDICQRESFYLLADLVVARCLDSSAR